MGRKKKNPNGGSRPPSSDSQSSGSQFDVTQPPAQPPSSIAPGPSPGPCNPGVGRGRGLEPNINPQGVWGRRCTAPQNINIRQAMPQQPGLRFPQDIDVRQPQHQGIRQPQAQGLRQPQAQGIRQPQAQGIRQPQFQGMRQPQIPGVRHPQNQGMRFPEGQVVRPPVPLVWGQRLPGTPQPLSTPMPAASTQQSLQTKTDPPITVVPQETAVAAIGEKKETRASVGTQPIPTKSKQESTDKGQSSADVLSEKFQSIVTFNRPNKTRPKNIPRGTLGRKIVLYANHFLMTSIPKNLVYHYDVSLKVKNQPSLSKTLTGEIVSEYQKKFPEFFPVGKFIFDGMNNFYSLKKVEDFNLNMPYMNPQNNRTLECSMDVKLVATVDMSVIQEFLNGKCNSMPQDQLRILDTVLKYSSSLDYLVQGRRIFPYQRGDYLVDATSLWFGWSNSVRPGWKCYVNIDLAAVAIYEEQKVLDFFHNKNFTVEGREWDVRTNKRGAKEIKGLKVEMRLESRGKVHKRVQRAIGLSPLSSLKERFEYEKDGKKKTISVCDYYMEEHGIKLEFPHLPCIHVGNKDRKVYLPMELCKILAGQKPLAIANEATALMIRKTAIPPKERFQKIKKSLDIRNYNADAHLKNFHMEISSNPVKLTGRVLNPPMLEVSSGSGPDTVTPRNGVWDMRGKKFMKGGEIKKWMILNLVPNRVYPDKVNIFAQTLVKVARAHGIVMAEVDPRNSIINLERNARLTDFLDKYFKLAKSNQVDLIVVILDEFGYGEVKLYGDCIHNVRTQCVKKKNVMFLKDQTIANICLKINGKIGGWNNAICGRDRFYPPVLRECTMLLGADVTHPSPGQTARPSIASVVASMNRHYNEYVGKTKLQISKSGKPMEIIKDLKNMIKDLLLIFYQRTSQRKPKNLIMFRDGVSEGQYEEVLAEELAAIQRACKEIEPTAQYEPLITYVIVGKRHHTRLMPADDRDGVGKCLNIPPGTVVDEEICHPTDFDFFLCSHAGIQGTSRPCHYYVIYDDGNFKNQDDMQVLAYYLCHVYARCTRSVSIPAPTYYAHLAAFRARQHLNIDDDSSSLASGDMLNNEQVEKATDQFMYFL